MSTQRLLTPAICSLMAFAGFAAAGDSAPPNWVPTLNLSYADPQSGERIACGEGCRRFSVPAGVELQVHMTVENTGGTPDGDGVPWDLWFDQRRHPFPGLDIAACRDREDGPVDVDCWMALFDRVDWDWWRRLEADRVCVPEIPDICGEVTINVLMDPDFDGSRGRGVYSFAAWVDRFQITTEIDEFDNFAGPVRVKVLPAPGITPADGPEIKKPAETMTTEGNSAEVGPGSSPMPYSVRILPGQSKVGFNLFSHRSRGRLEFSPLYAGEVTVHVEQHDTFENLDVVVRKVSTGEILAEAHGKGKLRLQGDIVGAHLKDDRRLEVVITLAHGSRGSRGTIHATYPAQAMYRRTE